MMEWRDLKEFAGQAEEGSDGALSGVAKLMTSGRRFNDVANFDCHLSLGSSQILFLELFSFYRTLPYEV